MKNKGISQEVLKLIACVTMLLDHVGAVLVNELFYEAAACGESAGYLLQIYEVLRIIGRLAFPIYCFLLAEGAHHTRNPKRYALRLGAAAVLSEIPYDLAFYGGLTVYHQNVMLTLLLGFLAIQVMEKCPNVGLKIMAAVPFAVLAKYLHTDYGANGVMVIALFSLTREHPKKHLLQFFGLWFLFSPSNAMFLNWLGGFRIVMQEWALLALIPIWLYSGQKLSWSKAVQWAFYLFYPVHILVLWMLEGFFFG